MSKQIDYLFLWQLLNKYQKQGEWYLLAIV